MERKLIDVEYEVRKYFLIYIFIACVIFLFLNIFKDFNLYEYYNNKVDDFFYELNVDSEKILSEPSKFNISEDDAKTEYYKFKDYLEESKYMLTYYFPALVLIAIFIISVIHVRIQNSIYNTKMKITQAIKLSKIIPIFALIVSCIIIFINSEENYAFVKTLDNINLIIAVVLITFGIAVVGSMINAREPKQRTILKMVNIVLILIFPKVYWFIGIFGSMFNVKIIKREGGNEI
ncbi:MAG: hypothetical protein A2Y24_07980 [Clostridiales bacterium GWE2_32_10]|nr:MAG: hypothetical protein A2Y24_07980 [Clostridiales bacterium GWE2_32_10]HBY20533.1 hypothetical protein [Clostridiales bacterium]